MILWKKVGIFPFNEKIDEKFWICLKSQKKEVSVLSVIDFFFKVQFFFFLEYSEIDDIFFQVISNILIKKMNICELVMD